MARPRVTPNKRHTISPDLVVTAWEQVTNQPHFICLAPLLNAEERNSRHLLWWALVKYAGMGKAGLALTYGVKPNAVQVGTKNVAKRLQDTNPKYDTARQMVEELRASIEFLRGRKADKMPPYTLHFMIWKETFTEPPPDQDALYWDEQQGKAVILTPEQYKAGNYIDWMTLPPAPIREFTKTAQIDPRIKALL